VRGTALLAVAALAGCGTTPEPAATSGVPTPAAFVQADDAGATAAEPVAQFWRAFGDATLDRLVEQAVAANTDLRVAAARVAEAQAIALGTEGLGRPTLDISAGASRVRAPNADGVSVTGNQFGLGLASSWEIDLFGRVDQTQRAAAASLASAEALQRAVRVSVAAEVARQYFELRGLQEQLRLARLALDTQRRSLALLQARLDAGRATALDTARARALAESTAASLPALDTALVRARLRLAVLTGGTPAALDALLREPQPLPGLPPTALSALGTPSTLLRRRPDVAAAEQQLRAAEADIGVARSALYPNLTLSGTLGLNAARPGDLGDAASFLYSLGASIAWSLVDHGQRQSQVSAAQARRDAALARFDQAVLAALEDTESALAGYTRAQVRSEHLLTAARSAEQAAAIARARLDAGSIDSLAVLDAERERLQARDSLAQSQTAAATALVGVYRALAGGW
jgi:multidrug efflux system outer membrane protein